MARVSTHSTGERSSEGLDTLDRRRSSASRPRRSGSGPRNLLHLEGFDDVALLDVLVVPQDETALEALADLGCVVLLPLQRRQVEVVRHDGAVADQSYLGVASDHTAGDHAAGDVAELRRAEDRADLRLAEGRLLELRLEHALEGRLDLLDRVVDDRVVADLDAFLVRQLGHLQRDRGDRGGPQG